MYRNAIPLFTLLGLCSLAFAEVSPVLVEAELAPGESMTVEKTVTLPVDTPKLDFLLVVDLTGSYYDDLPNIKNLADGLATDIRASVPDSQFGLVTFADFPYIPWGYTGDFAYRLDQDLTTDLAAWGAAVDAMTTYNGYDYPEAQYEGIYQAVTGAGNDVNGDGDYADTGEIQPGINATFRDDATRVIAITTDAAFHEGGEDYYSYPFPYPGATEADTLAALEARGIKVIAIKVASNNDATYVAQMQNLADVTGGAVVTTSSTSSEIADAVLAGLEALTYDVSASADAACPLDLSWAPESYDDVAGGETVMFVEEIVVPGAIDESQLDGDGNAVCTVTFRADDTVIGTESVIIHVPLNAPPIALCEDLALVADDDCSAWGDIDAGSYDPDGDPLVYSYSDPGPWTLGTRDVTLTVTDPDDLSSSCTATVSVADDAPPDVTAGSMRLWPPDHDYHTLDLLDCGVTAVDACGGDLDVLDVADIGLAWSDEAEDAKGGGDGATKADLLVLDNASFKVRSERMGGANGRVYTIQFVIDDGAGNETPSQCQVTIPHSDNGVPAVDDGPLYYAP